MANETLKAAISTCHLSENQAMQCWLHPWLNEGARFPHDLLPHSQDPSGTPHPPPGRHSHRENVLPPAPAVAGTALLPEWEVIYFKEWHEHLPLPQVRRKGRNLTPVLQSAGGLACPHSRHRSHLSAPSDTETLGFLCTLHSGNSLFSPLADIFIRLVKFPPTQTPTQDGYGKNTAKLGIHPWRTGTLITFF